MKRKTLIACVILLSVVFLCCLMFIVGMERKLAELPNTVPTKEVGSGDTAGTEAPGVSTQNTDPSNTPEATGEPENTTTVPEDTAQTQPKETTPPATTKPAETTKPIETTAPTQSTEPTNSTASTEEKLDPDELPLVPNK